MAYLYHFHAIAEDDRSEDGFAEMDGIMECALPVRTATDYQRFKSEVAAMENLNPDTLVLQNLSLIFTSEGEMPCAEERPRHLN